MVITMPQYWMGRDKAYEQECTLEVRRNAVRIVGLANSVLELAALQSIEPDIDPHTGTPVSSGWRPASLNHALERTSNAGTHSLHIIALAIDPRDHPDRRLARWCLRNLQALERLGLYMEDPRWTPTWVHWQALAPHSGKRVYIPSEAPPLALALPEQAAA
jgi:hypothetical protein